MSPEVRAYPTLKALREALAGNAGPAQLFVPGLATPELGDPTEIVLVAEREELEIPVSGVVTWRYPAGRAPPGRVEGVGVLLDAESQAQPLYRSVIDGLAHVVPPGGRLPELLQLSAEAEAEFDGNTESVSLEESELSSETGDGDLALADDDGFEHERTLSTDELNDLDDDPDEVPTLDQVEERELAPFETPELDEDFESAQTQADLSLDTADLPPEAEAELRSEAPVRPLPSSEPWPDLPAPMLSGRAWTCSANGEVVRQLVVVSWPDEGTQRNTWFDAQRARGLSPAQIFSSDEDEFDERTDPAQVPDAVTRATADLADEVADDDETILALPIGLWVTRADGAGAQPLFEAGVALPAETTFRMKAAKGAQHYEAQVLSEQWGAQERDLLGVVRFPVDEEGPRPARARATLSPTGLLEIAMPANDPKHTELIETGIVPVPLRASAISGERTGLLGSLKRLFTSSGD